MNRLPVDYREHDRQIWEEELDEFVPSRVYDCHIHLFSRDLVGPEHTDEIGYPDADFKTLQIWSSSIYPGREVHYLVLGRPAIGTDVGAHNRMMYEEVSSDPLSRMNRLTTPADTLAEIEADIKERGFVGIKVYRMFSRTGDVDNCRIHDFLTEEQMELASEMGLWVTLHMARPQGCADEKNLSDLEEYTTRRYPGIKWILAHCGRSFTYYQIRQAIDRLRQLPNIWYDMSAVTDVRPFVTLFQKEDPKRFFFGSDGIDSTAFHGKYMTSGRAWRQLATDEVESLDFPHTNSRPILCIYEQLLAMKHAAEISGLSRDQIEDMFWRNAVMELGVDWPDE